MNHGGTEARRRNEGRRFVQIRDWRFAFHARSLAFCGPPLAHLNERLAWGSDRRERLAPTSLPIADHFLNSRLFGQDASNEEMSREIKQSRIQEISSLFSLLRASVVCPHLTNLRSLVVNHSRLTCSMPKRTMRRVLRMICRSRLRDRCFM